MPSNAPGQPPAAAPSLGASARASLVWGGGAMIVHDVIQFATMLVLVRLLAPSDYGAMAFAQAVLGVIYVVSAGTFGAHALQMRDPAEVDWQAHFTFAVTLNAALCMLVLVLAYLLGSIVHFAAAAVPLAFLSLVLVVDVAGSMRYRMLQTAHDWKRFRILTLLGSVLSSSVAIAIALAGGGIWALIVQPVLALVPPTIDLFVLARFRPDWTWSRERYREPLRYGLNRAGSGVLFFSRTLNEQTVLAALYSFSLLGTFTRAIGLATIVAGRIGQVSSSMLYPVLTRADANSVQFKRNAGLVLQGVVWTTVPAAALLASMPAEFVAVLYGPAWREVVPLLPYASVSVALVGISFVVYNLLLANNQQRALLRLDVVAAVLGIVLVYALAGYGAKAYIAGMIGHGALMLGLYLRQLTRGQAIEMSGITEAFMPAVVATVVAVAAISQIAIGGEDFSAAALKLVALGTVFAIVYAAVLRLVFAVPLARLAEIAPGRDHVERILMLKRG